MNCKHTEALIKIQLFPISDKLPEIIIRNIICQSCKKTIIQELLPQYLDELNAQVNDMRRFAKPHTTSISYNYFINNEKGLIS